MLVEALSHYELNKILAASFDTAIDDLISMDSTRENDASYK